MIELTSNPMEFNGKTFRYLEQQVLKNKEDIEDFQSINGLLGIKIVGVVTEDSPLPAEDSEVFASLEYGDAYVEDLDPEEADTNYVFYVKTRPNTTITYDHWFELKLTGIQGPQGIQGIQGVQGIDGTYWTFGSTQPANPRIGDLYVNTDGNVYTWNGIAWVNKGSIKGPRGLQGATGDTGLQGPQGPQGSKGERGDPGAFIHIVGKLNSESLLPSPADIRDLSHAYLVKQASPSTAYDLYVQIGADFATAQWDNIGPLNVATYVTVNGVFQGQWNADTKLDLKVEDEELFEATDIVPIITEDRDGNIIQGEEGIAVNATANCIVQRNGQGQIILPATDPTSKNQAVRKQYVDSHLPQVVRLG